MDDREINKFVGMKIKEFRKNKKLTQQDLADLVGVKNSAISNYEQGTRIPKRDFLFMVANALGVSIDEFFPIQNEETSSILSEINKISSQLEEPRQKVVLDTANIQLKEQDEQNKVKKIEDYRLTDEYLEEQISKASAYGGGQLNDNDKEFFKRLLKNTLKEKIDKGDL